MQLLVAHQILIGAAAALAAIFGARGLVRFARGEGILDLVLAVVAFVVAAALVAYFRKVRARYLAARRGAGPRPN